MIIKKAENRFQKAAVLLDFYAKFSSHLIYQNLFRLNKKLESSSRLNISACDEIRPRECFAFHAEINPINSFGPRLNRSKER